MFYTKYRPQTFSEIAKPNDTALALMNQVKSGKTAHAYLCVGSRGTGKTTTARILAKALNCKKLKKTGDPCDKCDNCIAIKKGSFLDLIEIDAASNRGIDDIRELRDKVRLAPSVGSTKVYIIDEVHMLTTEAFNALLKTLEEPPKHCVFILCTTESHKVPTTIKSRCQVFKFKKATIAQIVAKLEKILKEEEVAIDISKEDLKKIAQAASGGFRDAETLLQQVVEGNISVEALLSLASMDSYIGFMELILKKDAEGALRYVNKLDEDGMDLYVWTQELIKYLRDLLFVKTNAHEGLIDVTKDDLSKIIKQANQISIGFLVTAISRFVEAYQTIKSAFLQQLPLELAIVDLCMEISGFSQVAYVPDPVDDKNDDDADSVVEKNEKPTKTKKEKENNKSSSPKDAKSSASPVTSDAALNLCLDEIKSKWGIVLEEVVQFNNSVQALLKACAPVAVEGNSLIVEALYAFHKERLESAKNREIVEKVLSNVFSSSITIKCKLSKNKPKRVAKKETGVLTDYNVVPAPDAKEVLKGSVVEIFDGSLPMV